MTLDQLPPEALASGKRVTLLFGGIVGGTPHFRIIHATTTGMGRNRAGEEATHYLLYKKKRQRIETATKIEDIKACHPGWLTLEEMTC
jgi:hypothetical protein